MESNNTMDEEKDVQIETVDAIQDDIDVEATESVDTSKPDTDAVDGESVDPVIIDSNHYPDSIPYTKLTDEQASQNTISIPHATLDTTVDMITNYIMDKENLTAYNSLSSSQQLGVKIGTTAMNDSGQEIPVLTDITTETFEDELPDGPCIYDIRLNNSKGKKYTGDKAVLGISASLGLNGWSTIQLPHTGIRVTLDTIHESEFSGLDITIRKAIGDIGRDTNGLIFSNSSILYDEILIDFILSRVKHTTLDIDNMLELKNYIKVTDKPMLIGGLLKNMYPNKFPYMTTCINNRDDGTFCGNVYRMDMSINSLFRFNKSRMTPVMREILGRRAPREVTIEDLEIYSNELNQGAGTYNIVNDVQMVLKMPTLADSIRIGLDWFDDMTMLINDTISVTDPEVRAAEVEELTVKSRLSEYSNIIYSISNDTSTITSTKHILDQLKTMQTIPAIANKVSSKITEFIKESVIAVMGTKVMVCDACKKSNKKYAGPNEDFRDIVPISDMAVFLNLRRLKGVAFQE